MNIVKRLSVKSIIFSLIWLVCFAQLGTNFPSAYAASLDAVSAFPTNSTTFLYGAVWEAPNPRLQVSATSSWEVIFNTVSALSENQSIVVTFPSGFAFTDFADSAVNEENYSNTIALYINNPSGAGYDRCISSAVDYSATSSQVKFGSSGIATSQYWGATIATSTRTVTIVAPTSTATYIAANKCVGIKLGVVTGANITNPATPGSYNLSISYASGVDTIRVGVPIVSSDTVSVTGAVDPNMAFAVGVVSSYCSATSTLTQGGSISFGAMGIASTNIASSSRICTRLTTNASYGAVVQALSVNGGLVSTRNSGDRIPATQQTSSASTTLAPGVTEAYGLCVASDLSTRGDYLGNYDDAQAVAAIDTSMSVYDPLNDVDTASCTPTSISHLFGKISTGYTNIWATGGTASSAYVSIIPAMTINNLSPAHNDYTDTLRFIAFGTF